MASRSSAGGLLATLLIVAACSVTQPMSPGPDGTSAVEPSLPASAPLPPTLGPQPTLPNGLAPRVGRPPLVAGEAAACIPDCGKGRAAGGKLPAGRYQTEWFFGGYMTLETDGTWERTEDSDGELSLPVSGSGEDTYRVAFFLDPILVVDDVMEAGIPRRAADYVTWLSKQAGLSVEEPLRTTIGTVPALAVDIRLAPGAPSQYEDCRPDPCVTFLKVPAFDHSEGILGDDVYRFYFADVTYSGTQHLLGVKVEGRNADDLESVLPKVEALLRTVVIPARPTPSAFAGLAAA